VYAKAHLLIFAVGFRCQPPQKSICKHLPTPSYRFTQQRKKMVIKKKTPQEF
jgi:hypothetical protein